ncbi:Uncharacterised protein [Shewanella putrefaciens]|nr:Uncharacterised protein [Shewanella putrefaciens]
MNGSIRFHAKFVDLLTCINKHKKRLDICTPYILQHSGKCLKPLEKPLKPSQEKLF